jgi:hypothetical protein
LHHTYLNQGANKTWGASIRIKVNDDDAKFLKELIGSNSKSKSKSEDDPEEEKNGISDTDVTGDTVLLYCSYKFYMPNI